MLSFQIHLVGFEFITVQQVSEFNLLGFIITLAIWAPVKTKTIGAMGGLFCPIAEAFRSINPADYGTSFYCINNKMMPLLSLL
ncbi:MAG: hypothetical protein ACFFER_18710 [Candidatus Thorarchaeota archaeon]